MENNALVHKNESIRIYACGGAGIGVGRYFESDRAKVLPGHSVLHPAYIDTSTASFYDLPEEHFYILPDAAGSGGVRKFNGQDIITHTGEILQKFPPLEYNIVISSTTGGSGSVLGPSILSELLDRDIPVMVFAIGSDDTMQYITNTINTMLSFEHISKTRNKPVVMTYLQNGKNGTVEQVDDAIRMAISCLTVLFSGQNKNLDSRDIYNWLNFHNVTTYTPQVGVLDVHRHEVSLVDANLISVLTINKDLNDTKLDVPVEYQRVGVPVNIEPKDAESMKFPLHFTITDGYVDTVMKSLKNQLTDYETKSKSRVIKNKLADGSENVAENGLVF